MQVSHDGVIQREGIIGLWEELSRERIVYVCAPAGYGKTHAVRQWLDRDPRAKAIHMLDERDNNLELFCERFCAALRACHPQNAALAEIVSHPARAGAPDEFALRAIAALEEAEPSVLVIDDLHLVTAEDVLRVLLVFLKRLPESVQIVLISRSDLSPGFSDLWFKGKLARLTAENLLFTSEEIMALYKNRGCPLSRQQAEAIRRITGGWAIGVNALLLSGAAPAGGNVGFLEQFILENVWDRWDEPTREFMLRTALARELRPELCTALTGEIDSEKLLRGLMRGGAFLFRSSDGAYHYHHLFQSFLKKMLQARGEEFMRSLLETEGGWHLERQDFYSAADCFLQCGSLEGIALCFDTMESGEQSNFVIERMLSIIQTPAFYGAAQKTPFLFAYLGWAAFAAGRAKDMEAVADEYYARFPEILEKTPHRARDVYLLRLVDYRVSLRELLQPGAALYMPSGSGEPKGSISMNMPLLHRCARDFSELSGEHTEPLVAKMKETVGWVFGEAADLLAACLAAGLLFEQGKADRAHVYALTANAQIKSSFAPELKFCAMSVLLCVLDALGLEHDAAQAVTRIAAMIEQDRAYYLNENFSSMLARRRLANGDIAAARKWIAEHESAARGELSFYGVYSTLTTCRAYITAGDFSSATRLLGKTLELVEAYRRPADIMETKILLAIACRHAKRGRQKDAVRYLEEAVAVAHEYGYTQIFVSEGAELSGMLRRLQKRAEQRAGGNETPVSFIKTLYLKSLEHRESGLTSGQPAQAVKYTEKQRAIMKLLSEGKSYRTIAQSLGIQVPTLRSHLSLIYKKLDVTEETEAILKIKRLGLHL